MDIQTIRTNLQRTIVGKEAMLIRTQEARKLASRGEDIALRAMVQFLEVNLVELRNILKDLDQVANQSKE